jgi:hypothetical protein
LEDQQMTNEVDRLMDEDPLNLSAQDIDEVIKIQRRYKANFDAGIKSPKGDSPKIDVKALLGLSLVQSGGQQPTVTRRR